MAKNSRNAAMDTARVVACFMVVMLHSAAVNFDAFDDRWWASNFYDSFTRSCVPIFLMISGVLLLGKQESLPEFFKKRLSRVLPPLAFWSLFYMAWGTIQGQQYGGWYGWLKEVLSGPVEFHLWYLYAIVGIYLFVPFLRNIWSASQDAEKKVYLLCWALVSAWPTVEALLGIEANILDTYGLGSFFGLIGYLFLGAYLREVWLRHEQRTRYWWCNAALFMVFSVLTMLATYLWSLHRGAPDALFYDYLSPFVIASSACAFTVLGGLGAKAGDFAGPLKRISACTLGVYCLHVFVLDALGPLTGLGVSGGWAWLGIPVTAVSVFGVTLAAVWLLRRFRPFVHVT